MENTIAMGHVGMLLQWVEEERDDGSLTMVKLGM